MAQSTEAPAPDVQGIPRVFGLFRDVYEEGVIVESRPVAWAMKAPDGSVAAVSVAYPYAWTVYESIVDAEVELRAWAGNFDQRQLDRCGGDLAVTPEPEPSSAAASPAGLGGQDG